MASIKVACVVLMCMAMVAAPIAQVVRTCDQVIRSIAPCINYLTNGGAVRRACCDGVKTVVSLAQTTADKKTVCICLKALAATKPTFKNANAESLPGKCGVSIPYKFSTATDCYRIKF